MLKNLMAKKINVNYDIKSIEKAIQQMERVKKELKATIPRMFLDRCLDYVIERANEYLDSFIIDESIVSDIQNHWRKEQINHKRIRLINDSDKAVFIEFGVGRVGEIAQHPNSNRTRYRYNIPTKSKDDAGQWAFKLDEQQGVDLVVGYYKQKDNVVITKGSPANMYLYNAMLDLISSGRYKDIWVEVLKERL